MRKSQNIVILGPAHPLRGGGISTFNERLARELQQLNHQVSLFSFAYQYPDWLFPGTSQFTDEPPPQDLKIRSILHSLNPINWLIVGLMLRRLAPDFIIVRYWMPFFGPCLGTILRLAHPKTQVVCIADNIIPHEPRWFDTLATRFFVSVIDRFIAMSPNVLEDIKSVSAAPTKLIDHPTYDTYDPPVAPSAARKHLGLDVSGSYLLFFGFIRAYKGLDILLHALTDERLKSRNVKLIVAGEFYDNQESIKNLVVDLELNDRVVFFDHFIPNSEVHHYFCAADAVILPYRRATQSGISQIATFYRIPQIVTDLPGLTHYVRSGESGVITAPTAAALADGIEYFFKQPWKFKVPSNAIDQSWKTFTEAILNP